MDEGYINTKDENAADRLEGVLTRDCYLRQKGGTVLERKERDELRAVKAVREELRAREKAEQERLARVKQKPADIKKAYELNAELLSDSGAYDLLRRINDEILKGKGRVLLVQNAQVTHTHYRWGAYHDSAPSRYDREHLYSYCLLSWQEQKEYFHLMVVAEGGSQELNILGSVGEDAKKQWQKARALPCEREKDSPDENCHFKHICYVDFSGVNSGVARAKLEEQLADAFLRITSPNRPYGGFGPSTLAFG